MWNKIFAGMSQGMQHTLGSGVAGTGQVVSSSGHVTIDFAVNNSSNMTNLAINNPVDGGTNPFLFLIVGLIIVIVVAMAIEKFS